MTLDKVGPGMQVTIDAIPDQRIRAQAIRLGIGEGSVVTCAGIIPAGPVIVARGRQEIALGRHLAEQIRVRPTRQE